RHAYRRAHDRPGAPVPHPRDANRPRNGRVTSFLRESGHAQVRSSEVLASARADGKDVNAMKQFLGIKALTVVVALALGACTTGGPQEPQPTGVGALRV